MTSLVQNKTEWNAWILKMDSYDFYHTYEYHETLKKDNEKPTLIVYQKENTIIAIPFLKREIYGSNYFDLTSVHGYVGPVSSNLDPNFDNTLFIEEFNAILKKENIISVFSKLNPFISNQESIIKTPFSKIETTGELVYFDQQMDDESQVKAYNKNTKQKIRQLKKNSTVSYITQIDSDDYKEFIYLYHKGMERLKAKELFYFNEDYFSTLLNSDILNAKMIVAKHNDTNEIMGGVFCVNSKSIVHIELAFTNELYYKFSPVRILFENSRLLFKNDEIKFLNMGGGTGGREGSLMKFKSTFSKLYKEIKVWKHIVNEDVYNNLIQEKQREMDSSFFPLYRLVVSP